MRIGIRSVSYTHLDVYKRQIAEKSGLIDRCRYRIEPLIKWLFPGVPSESKAFGYIVTNMISNFLGLGWAATPAGIKAMKEMAVLNENKNIASCDMCTFLVINISSIQLIPVNIIAYRSPVSYTHLLAQMVSGCSLTLYQKNMKSGKVSLILQEEYV